MRFGAALALLVTGALFLGACGNGDDEATTDGATATTETTTETAGTNGTTDDSAPVDGAPAEKSAEKGEDAFLEAFYSEKYDLPPAVTDATILAVGRSTCKNIASGGPPLPLPEDIPDSWKVGAPGGFEDETIATFTIGVMGQYAKDYLC